MKSVTPFCFATLSVALFAVACGGANVSESDFADPGADTGVATTDTSEPGKQDTGEPGPKKDSDTPAVDTTPADTSTPITVENVCTRFADAVCTSSLSTCCGTKGLMYKESGCKAAITKDCEDKKAAVAAGRTTFNAGAYDACVSSWTALSAKCSVGVLDFVKLYAPCNQLFNGTTPFNSACSEDYHCKVSPGAYANCTNENRCDATTIVGNGAPCGLVGTNRAYCDAGLYCNYTTSSSGTCRETKIGNPCSDNYQCGIGNYCSRTFGGGSGNCAAGLGAGAMCGFSQQCASGTCASGRCTDPNVTVASREVCGGGG